jgi:hypothetical protein
MDFMTFIGSQEPVVDWTTAEQLKLLDSLAYHFGWRDSEAPTINKKQFVNTKFTQKIKGWVNKARKVEAMEAVIYDAIDLGE